MPTNLSTNLSFSWNIAAGAAVADYDGIGWVADGPYELVRVVERHLVAGSVGTAEIQIYKAPSGTAKASGTAMLAGTGMLTNGTANTNQVATLSTTIANRQVAEGDLVAPVLDEAATSFDGVTITLYFKGLGGKTVWAT